MSFASTRGTAAFMTAVLGVLGVLVVAATVFTPGAAQAQSSGSLSLNLLGLEPLAAGHYEGWAIFGEEKVSTGKFAVASDGSLETLDGAPVSVFEVNRGLASADQIVITIEPEGDTDDLPSGIVVLAGALNDGTASLAFPVDLSGAAGGYILATPTDDDATNDVAGVWFLDPSGPAAALTLPALPDGWVYEGWGVTQGTPLSSGRFTDIAAADLMAPFSGPNAGPPFPGEDFVANLPDAITPPVNLADGASLIVISVEPDLAGVDPTGAGPFSIKPLVGDVPEGLADHTLTAMGANLGTVPSGTASVSVAAPEVRFTPNPGGYATGVVNGVLEVVGDGSATSEAVAAAIAADSGLSVTRLWMLTSNAGWLLWAPGPVDFGLSEFSGLSAISVVLN